MTKLSQAGFYTLRSVKLKPLFPGAETPSQKNMSDYIDITKVVANWSFAESMDAPYISGRMTIQESDNLLEDLPIRGEESLQITYTDFYGDTITKDFIVYAVDNIGPENSINDRMMKYTLDFTTRDKLNSDTREIRRSFAKQKISEMATTIFKEYYPNSSKEIEVEETDGEQTVVIPSLYPDAAMQFLSRRAYSQNNKTSLYKFFETGEKYYFCTHEYLIDKYADFEGISDDARNRLFFIYSTLNDNTGSGQLRAQQSINDITYGKKVDSFIDIKDGAYRRNVTELDIMNRTRIARTYDYSTEYKDYKAPQDLKLTHSQDFVDSYMGFDGAPDTTLITDFTQIGQNRGELDKPYQHFYENYTTKPVVDYHMNLNSFTIDIQGRSELYPGMVIKLDLYKFSNTLAGTREIDTQRSGKYIVLSINHSFSGDSYSQAVRITKGGLS
mgnify:CR=1 FL=1|tara:strand:- start:1302 stop:2630 length:1329 start_codon:yes stop_codon:yes gene_type:complete